MYEHRDVLHLALGSFLAVIIALPLTSCVSGGRRSPAEVAQAYAAAAGSGREGDLLQLVPPDFESNREVAEKIQKWHGADVAAVRSEYQQSDVSPFLVHVRLIAPGVTDEIDVQKVGDRWYVMLGKKRGFSPGPTAATR